MQLWPGTRNFSHTGFLVSLRHKDEAFVEEKCCQDRGERATRLYLCPSQMDGSQHKVTMLQRPTTGLSRCEVCASMLLQKSSLKVLTAEDSSKRKNHATNLLCNQKVHYSPGLFLSAPLYSEEKKKQQVCRNQ